MAEKNNEEDLFVAAVIAGNVKEMEKHMKHECEGPLKIAASHGQTECVRRILELGGDKYSVGEAYEGWSVYDSVHQRMASTFVSDDYFDAVLVACTKGHIETVLALIQYRLFEVPSLQEQYKDFVKAAKEGDFQKIGQLLELVEDKDVYLKGWKGHNIMNLCLFLGCPSSCLQTMVDHGIGVNGWDYNGYTPIMAAIFGRNVECVKFLLDTGVDPYDIHIAQRASFHDDGEVRFYESLGYEVEVYFGDDEKWTNYYQERVGRTALMNAAAMGNIPILKMMLKAAPIDNRFFSRFEAFEDIRPLHLAAEYATLEAMSLIKDLEEDDPDDNGRMDEETLSEIIQKDNTEFFDFYLERMAAIKDSKYGSSIGACVSFQPRPKYLKKILDVCKDNVFEIGGNDAFFSSVTINTAECFRLFVNRSEFSVDMRSTHIDNCRFYSLTGFMASCREGRAEFARILLDMGADLNAIDAKGRTAAMFAAREGRLECLKLLFDHKADFDSVDNAGGTVFSAALMGDGLALEFLLEKGVMLDGNGLKEVHKESLKYFSLRSRYDGFGWNRRPISIKNILLLMQNKVFHWEWCTVVDRPSFQNIMFAAVTLGISPGKFSFNNRDISPFVYAVLSNDVDTVRYLLANEYFLPEDYRCLSDSTSQQGVMNFDDSPDMTFLIEKLTLKPLSLKTWNVMTISESLVSPESCTVPDKRTDQVHALPLPNILKDILKGRNNFYQLCSRHWKRLGPRKEDNPEGKFDEIVINGELAKQPSLEKCAKEKCHCGGLALTLKEIEDEDDVGPIFTTFEEGENPDDYSQIYNEDSQESDNDTDDESEDGNNDVGGEGGCSNLGENPDDYSQIYNEDSQESDNDTDDESEDGNNDVGGEGGCSNLGNE